MNKKIYANIIISILISIVLSFIVFIIAAITILPMFYDTSTPVEDQTLIFILMQFLFCFSCGKIFIKRSSEERKINHSILKNEKFDWKKDLIEYYQQPDGKHLLIAFAVLAIIMEVCCLIKSQNPVTAFLVFSFPFFALLEDIPVLRIVIGYIANMIMISATIAFEHYRVHRYWTE